MIFKLLKYTCIFFTIFSERVKRPLLAPEKLFVLWFEGCSISLKMDIWKFYIMSEEKKQEMNMWATNDDVFRQHTRLCVCVCVYACACACACLTLVEALQGKNQLWSLRFGRHVHMHTH